MSREIKLVVSSSQQIELDSLDRIELLLFAAAWAPNQ